jgi:hypothetical protein
MKTLLRMLLCLVLPLALVSCSNEEEKEEPMYVGFVNVEGEIDYNDYLDDWCIKYTTLEGLPIPNYGSSAVDGPTVVIRIGELPGTTQPEHLQEGNRKLTFQGYLYEEGDFNYKGNPYINFIVYQLKVQDFK